jgi:hypothetical protein
MTEETTKEKTSKAPSWIEAALKKKQNQSHSTFDNSSNDFGHKSSKPKSNSKSSPLIPHRTQK